MSRFDYVKYDQDAGNAQGTLKSSFESIEKEIDEWLSNGRAKALALTALEECFMWIGKAIRDDQIERNGSADLQEERKND